MEYDNNMRGVAFKNEKATTDRHPQLTGSAEIDGKKYFLSIWKKLDRNGNEFLSFAFKPADEAYVKSTPQQGTITSQSVPVKNSAKIEMESDDIPF
jgi:hypothetical protein